MPSSVILAPGVGPQGGTSADIAALRREAGGGVLVPVSRGITKVDDLTVSRDGYGAIIHARIEELARSLS